MRESARAEAEEAGSDLGHVDPTSGLGSGAFPALALGFRRRNQSCLLHSCSPPPRSLLSSIDATTHRAYCNKEMSNKPKAEAKVPVLKGQEGTLSRVCSVGRTDKSHDHSSGGHGPCVHQAGAHDLAL